MPTPELTATDHLREQILEALLQLVAFDGWTESAMREAAAAAGLSDDELILAAPGGVDDLVEAFFDDAGRQMVQSMETADLSSMKIRERVSLGVEAYLDALSPNKDAVRKAVARTLARPWTGLSPVQRAWRVADAIWTTLGDTSNDFNYYSKRTILSGVIASTLTAWLGSEDMDTAKSFLANRIENVMAFEAFKARFKRA